MNLSMKLYFLASTHGKWREKTITLHFQENSERWFFSTMLLLFQETVDEESISEKTPASSAPAYLPAEDPDGWTIPRHNRKCKKWMLPLNKSLQNIILCFNWKVILGKKNQSKMIRTLQMSNVKKGLMEMKWQYSERLEKQSLMTIYEQIYCL